MHMYLATAITKLLRSLRNYIVANLVMCTKPVRIYIQIHEQLVANSSWSSHLKNISWRVDLQTKARHIEQINQPSAIVEMKLGPAGNKEVGYKLIVYIT